MAHNRYSFRHHILQDQKDRLHLHAYVWQGYAARIDTVQTYYRRSMELLDPAQRRLLFDPRRPILAKENDAPPTYLDPAGVCENSLIADGCDIQGSVKNCILFRGVRVEKGAQVENCVLFKGTVVKKDAHPALRHCRQGCDHPGGAHPHRRRELSRGGGPQRHRINESRPSPQAAGRGCKEVTAWISYM